MLKVYLVGIVLSVRRLVLGKAQHVEGRFVGLAEQYLVGLSDVPTRRALSPGK